MDVVLGESLSLLDRVREVAGKLRSGFTTGDVLEDLELDPVSPGDVEQQLRLLGYDKYIKQHSRRKIWSNERTIR